MTRILKGWNALAVQDSYKVMPWADAMYGCNEDWWNANDGASGFVGRKWSSHQADAKAGVFNDKSRIKDKYNLNLVAGAIEPDFGGFSEDASVIHYGSNSGYQSINLALLLQGFPTEPCYIVLVGFDMRCVDGKNHFFGDHPKQLHNNYDYDRFIKRFEGAAKKLPEGATIINATPDSALRCFPMMSLEDAIENYSLHRDRAVANG